MFKDIYLQIIAQMNNQDVSNISQNIQNEDDLNKIFSADDYFTDKPLEYGDSKYIDYYTLDEIQLEEVDIQIDNEYFLCYIKLFGPIEIEYRWSPYQPRTWEDPGNPGGLQEIYSIEWPFTKNFNDKNNDDVVELLKCSKKDTFQEVPCEFSELPIKVRYAIFKKLKEYIYSEQFFDQLKEILQQNAENAKEEAALTAYQNQKDYYG